MSEIGVNCLKLFSSSGTEANKERAFRKNEKYFQLVSYLAIIAIGLVIAAFTALVMEYSLNNLQLSIITGVTAGVASGGVLYSIRKKSNYVRSSAAAYQVFQEKQPKYSVKADSKKIYTDLKGKLKSLPEEIVSRIQFQDRALTICFLYDFPTLIDLCREFIILNEIFEASKQQGPFNGKPLPNPHLKPLFSIEPMKARWEKMAQESKDYFSTLSLPARQEIKIDRAIVTKIRNEDFFEQFSSATELLQATNEILRSIFKQSEGLCVGEKHHYSASYYFLSKYMPLFSECGVKTLFLEGLSYHRQQEIDAYLKNPSSPLPAFLKAACKRGSDAPWRLDSFYSYEDILLAAKNAGIRIIAVESEASMVAVLPAEDIQKTSRLAIMNYQAKLIIDKHKAEGKYVILCGSNHAARTGNYPDFRHEPSIPSLSDIYGCPNLLIKDHQHYTFSAPTLDCNPNQICLSQNLDDHKDGFFDFYIGMPSPIKFTP